MAPTSQESWRLPPCHLLTCSLTFPNPPQTHFSAAPLSPCNGVALTVTHSQGRLPFSCQSDIYRSPVLCHPLPQTAAVPPPQIITHLHSPLVTLLPTATHSHPITHRGTQSQMPFNCFSLLPWSAAEASLIPPMLVPCYIPACHPTVGKPISSCTLRPWSQQRLCSGPHQTSDLMSSFLGSQMKTCFDKVGGQEGR